MPITLILDGELDRRLILIALDLYITLWRFEAKAARGTAKRHARRNCRIARRIRRQIEGAH
jgi:hypothetical protein